MRRPSVEELRSFCIKNRFFEGGTNSQYEKMFFKLEQGAPMKIIAELISFCSDVDSDIVMEELEKAFPEIFEVTLNEWEAATICDALNCYIDNADITEIDDLDGVKQLLQRFI